ncbi:MAG: hypothetical protein GKR89_09595 [Candidatus Latescibacteria bacterium]|nr:hypothetical protein [Candidatus Latescibacterota bacterium]
MTVLLRPFGGLALAALLIWLVGPQLLVEVLGQTDPALVGAALALGLVGLGVQWLKWHALLRWARPKTRWFESLDSLLVGLALGLVSPGRLGELGRGTFLGGKRARWAGLAGVDRMISALVTLVFGGMALIILRPQATGWVGLGALLLLGTGLLGRRLLQDLGRRWAWWDQVGQAIRTIPPGLWLNTVFWSLLFNLVFFAQFYLILLSWGPVSLQGCLAIPLLFALKSLIPFSFLDLGVREGAAVLIFSWLALPPETALGAALVVFVINVLLPGLAGAGLVYRRGSTALTGPGHTGRTTES